MSLVFAAQRSWSWIGARPHVGLVIVLSVIVGIGRLRSRRWPETQEMMELLIGLFSLWGALRILKEALTKTEMELNGMALPLTLGGVAVATVAVRKLAPKITVLWTREGKADESDDEATVQNVSTNSTAE